GYFRDDSMLITPARTMVSTVKNSFWPMKVFVWRRLELQRRFCVFFTRRCEVRIMDELVQYFKLAVRQLRRNPGFTTTVVLTLALSIGANTAIFSIVNALLLKELPYAHPERIGTIFARTTGTQPGDERKNIDGEQWELLRDNVPSLISAVSGLRAAGINFRAGSHAQYV